MAKPTHKQLASGSTWRFPDGWSSATEGVLDQVTVTHGPAPLIGRFLLKAEHAVHHRGLTLSFAAMDELLALNERNRDTWLPLFPLFDPTYNSLTKANAFCVLGYNQQGEAVAAQAGRLFDWADTNLHDEATSFECSTMRPLNPRTHMSNAS